MALTDRHVQALRCPVCADAMSLHDRVVRCARGHSSDLARQGYVHLSGTQVRHSGDTADMVAARLRVQDAGLHDVVARAITDAALPAIRASQDTDDARGPLVVDVGAGTAHHLAHLVEASGAWGLALDSSTYAARRAARAHDRIGVVIGDTAAPLPMGDGCAAVVLSAFAPRPVDELRRVLAPEGRLVVAHPLGDHMAELVGPLGLLDIAPDKAASVDEGLSSRFTLAEEHEVRAHVPVTPDQLLDLVLMGPNAFHQDPAQLRDRIEAMPPPPAVTVAVRVAVHT